MASTRQSTRQVRKRFSIKPQRHSSDQPYSCRVLMDFVRYGESILEQQSFFNSTQETRDVENHFLEGFSSSIAFEAFRGEHGDCTAGPASSALDLLKQAHDKLNVASRESKSDSRLRFFAVMAKLFEARLYYISKEEREAGLVMETACMLAQGAVGALSLKEKQLLGSLFNQTHFITREMAALLLYNSSGNRMNIRLIQRHASTALRILDEFADSFRSSPLSVEAPRERLNDIMSAMTKSVPKHMPRTLVRKQVSFKRGSVASSAFKAERAEREKIELALKLRLKDEELRREREKAAQLEEQLEKRSRQLYHSRNPLGTSSRLRHEGFLMKKGVIRRNWTRRWFQIEGRMLLYFKDEKSVKPKGAIILDGATVRVSNHAKYLNYFEVIPLHEVNHGDARKFHLRADTARERQEWVDSLSRVAKGNTYGDSSDELPKRWGEAYTPRAQEASDSLQSASVAPSVALSPRHAKHPSGKSPSLMHKEQYTGGYVEEKKGGMGKMDPIRESASEVSASRSLLRSRKAAPTSSSDLSESALIAESEGSKRVQNLEKKEEESSQEADTPSVNLIPPKKQGTRFYTADRIASTVSREAIGTLLRNFAYLFPVFQSMDSTTSGQIEKDEFRQAIRTVGFNKISEQDISSLTRAMATGASGKINYKTIRSILSTSLTMEPSSRNWRGEGVGDGRSSIGMQSATPRRSLSGLSRHSEATRRSASSDEDMGKHEARKSKSQRMPHNKREEQSSGKFIPVDFGYIYDNGVIARAQEWKKRADRQGCGKATDEGFDNVNEKHTMVEEQKDDVGSGSIFAGPTNGSSSALELHKHTSYIDWLTAEAEAFRSSPMLKRQKLRFESQTCYAWEESDGETDLQGSRNFASDKHIKEPWDISGMSHDVTDVDIEYPGMPPNLFYKSIRSKFAKRRGFRSAPSLVAGHYPASDRDLWIRGQLKGGCLYHSTVPEDTGIGMELGSFTKTTYSTRQPFDPPPENKMDCLATLGEKMYRYSARGAIREGEDAYVEQRQGKTIGAANTSSADARISPPGGEAMESTNWAVSPIEEKSGKGGATNMNDLQLFIPHAAVSLLGASKSAEEERKEHDHAIAAQEEARAWKEEETKKQDAMQRAEKWALKVSSTRPRSTPSWMWFAWQAWEEEHMQSGVELLLDEGSGAESSRRGARRGQIAGRQRIFETERISEEDNMAPVSVLSESQYVLPPAYFAYENAYGSAAAVLAFESGAEAISDYALSVPRATGSHSKKLKSGSASAPVSPTTKTVGRSSSSPSSPAVRAAASAVATGKARQRGFLAASQAATLAVSMARAATKVEDADLEPSTALPQPPGAIPANSAALEGDKERDGGDRILEKGNNVESTAIERISVAVIDSADAGADIEVIGIDASERLAGMRNARMGREDGAALEEGAGATDIAHSSSTGTDTGVAVGVTGVSDGYGTPAAADSIAGVGGSETNVAVTGAQQQPTGDDAIDFVGFSGSADAATAVNAATNVPAGTIDHTDRLEVDIRLTGSNIAVTPASPPSGARARRKKQPQLPASLFSGTSQPTSYARLHLSNR